MRKVPTDQFQLAPGEKVYGPYPHGKGKVRFHIVSGKGRKGRRTRYVMLELYGPRPPRKVALRPPRQPPPPRVRHGHRYNGTLGGDRHREIVQQLLNRGANGIGFSRALREIGCETTLQPDAWLIKGTIVDAFEVSIHDPIKVPRLARYIALHADLKAHGRALRLFRIEHDNSTVRIF